MWKMCVYIHKQKYLYMYDGYNIYLYTHFPVHLMDMWSVYIIYILTCVQVFTYTMAKSSILCSFHPGPQLGRFLAKAGQHGSMGLGCSEQVPIEESSNTFFKPRISWIQDMSNVSPIESFKKTWLIQQRYEYSMQDACITIALKRIMLACIYIICTTC